MEQQLTVNELVVLKEYASDFEPIRQAINALPYSIEPHNVLDIIESFNNQLADCKNAVGYHGNIFALEQLRCLKQHLTVYKLKELKEYSSEISSIQQAIDRIPSNMNTSNASRIIELFNHEIADCKIGADYTEKVLSKEQVEELEQRLLDCDESLGQIWHALPVNKPNCQKISTIKRWLEDIKNQPLLDTVTSLDLSECHIVRLPRELRYLRKLAELNLSVNEQIFIPKWIRTLVEMKELNIYYKQCIRLSGDFLN